MNFVPTRRGGWVNLDRVETIETKTGCTDGSRMVAYLDDKDARFVELNVNDSELDMLFADFVPVEGYTYLLVQPENGKIGIDPIPVLGLYVRRYLGGDIMGAMQADGFIGLLVTPDKFNGFNGGVLRMPDDRVTNGCTVWNSLADFLKNLDARMAEAKKEADHG